jgi:hypothetical protein
MQQDSKAYEEFRPRMLKWLGMYCLMLPSACLGWWKTCEANASAWNRVEGWLATAFCVVCALVALVHLIPGGFWMRVGREGMAVRSMWRKPRFYKWTDIKEFGVAEIQAGVRAVQFVGIKFSDSFGGWNGRKFLGLRKFNRDSSGGYDTMFSDNYGWPVCLLAMHLNQLREFYLNADRNLPARPPTIGQRQAGITTVEDMRGEGDAPPVFHWSETVLKFTVVFGAFAQTALISELYSRWFPIFGILGLMMPPVVLFLFVRPGEHADWIVRKSHSLAAAWHLLAGLTLACLFLMSGCATAPWLVVVFPLLAAGAVPCAIVLYRAVAEWLEAPAKTRRNHAGD